jgi:hypothetical protein
VEGEEKAVKAKVKLRHKSDITYWLLLDSEKYHPAHHPCHCQQKVIHVVELR